MIYMIDSLRRQQIDEVLQYDRNMNLQVLSLEKRGMSKMNESADITTTQNQEVIRGGERIGQQLHDAAGQKEGRGFLATALHCSTH